jgi:subtilisin family serine protease
MTHRQRRRRDLLAPAVFGALACLKLSTVFAETTSVVCPAREFSDTFAGGMETNPFDYSSRYESVTFVNEQGTPRSPGRDEIAALAKAVSDAKLGTVLEGTSMREFGSVVIRLPPGVIPDDSLRQILGRAAVAGRDRASGVGNPIYDGGDVDYLLVNQAIVQFRSTATDEDIDALLGQYCAQTVKRRQRAGAWRHVVRFDGEVARHALAMTNRLIREGIVSFAQPDVIVVGEADVQSGLEAAVGATCPADVPNSGVDPYFSRQWHLEHSPAMPGDPAADINAQDAWAIAQGEGVILAILDDAVEGSHEDLTGRIHSEWNAFDGGNDLEITDRDGHGTPVAGIAGAMTENVHGIKATAPEVKLMPVRVLRHLQGPGGNWGEEHPYSVVVDGIEIAAANGASVISMSISLGKRNWKSCDNRTPPKCQGDLEAAAGALNGSAVLVFAAGNYGSEVVFPASLSGAMTNVIAVGATDEFDKIKTIDPNIGGDWGSSHGPEISVVAPGIKVLTTDRMGAKGFCPGNYVEFLGTSASTPIVAGAAALMQSQYIAGGGSPLAPADLKARLQATAVDLGQTGFDEYYGHGRLDACKALMQDSCPKRRPWIFLLAALALVALGVGLWCKKASRKV